jgi:hypothetical protein
MIERAMADRGKDCLGAVVVREDLNHTTSRQFLILLELLFLPIRFVNQQPLRHPKVGREGRLPVLSR